jgi:hypothetical protein
MAATKTAPRRPRPASILEETFTSEGRNWLWREGPSVLPERYRAAGDQAREELRALFVRKLVPAMERRGIAGEAVSAATPSGIAAADVRWMKWFRADEGQSPLWGLFVQSRVFDSNDADNDTWVLVAWGDGPALAWVSDTALAQRCLRAALHAPPAFLSGGLLSRDPSFAVRLERTTRSDSRARKSATTARKSALVGADQEAGPDSPHRTASRAAAPGDRPAGAHAILAAWRRANPARSA